MTGGNFLPPVPLNTDTVLQDYWSEYPHRSSPPTVMHKELPKTLNVREKSLWAPGKQHSTSESLCKDGTPSVCVCLFVKLCPMGVLL